MCSWPARSTSLLAAHRRLIGPRRDPHTVPTTMEVIEESHTDRQSTMLVRTEEPVFDPSVTVEEVGLEDMVLAYMSRASTPSTRRRRRLAVASMSAVAWRLFRSQAVWGAAALVAVGAVLLATGPHLVHVYDSGCVGLQECRRGRARLCQLGRRHLPTRAERRGRRGAHRPGAGRDLLGGAAHRPGARDGHLPSGLDPGRDPDALADHEAGLRGAGEPARRRRAQLGGHVVVRAHRRREPEPLQPRDLPGARDRARRLRPVRLRPGGDVRRVVPPGPARHGHDPRGLHRGALRRHLRGASPSAPPPT